MLCKNNEPRVKSLLVIYLRVEEEFRTLRKWQPTLVFLPEESHGRRSLGGYSPRGRKESDTTERLHSLRTLKGEKTLSSATSSGQLQNATFNKSYRLGNCTTSALCYPLLHLCKDYKPLLKNNFT